MNNQSVPVIMYHSIGIPDNRWKSNYLTCSYSTFESHLKWIKRSNYNTISLNDLYSYMKQGKKIPKKSLLLTFDDGYLDNWVFAYPLLKKYKLNGTVYVNPDFVDKRKIIRYNLENVWNDETHINNLETLGYLSWEELNIMEEEGFMDVQSHTLTHTWYPKNPKIIDFRHPNDPYVWITWNNFPDKKPYLQADQEDLIFYGEPVYENDRALSVRRYFEDQNLKKALIDYVNEVNFDIFNDSNRKRVLYNYLREHVSENHCNGRFETDKEYKKRVFYELSESKRVIGKKLDKNVNFLCWPGGGVTEDALEIAAKVGYLSSTAAKDLIHKRSFLKNQFGEDPSRINRLGTTLYWNGRKDSHQFIKHKNGFLLISSLNIFERNKFSKISYLLVGGTSKLYKIRSKLSTFF